MRIATLVVLFLLASSTAFGVGAPSYLPDGAHPRIWLTAQTLTELKAKRDANSADYQALITWCDAHLNDTGYAGGDPNWPGGLYTMGRTWGYSVYLLNFSLAYQMLKGVDDTKAAAYATYVRNILVDGIAAGLKAGEENNGLKAIRNDNGGTGDATINLSERSLLGITATYQYKLGYPARFLMMVPVAYDWIYDTLSPSDKVVLVNMMYRWFDWTRGARSAYNNGVLVSGTRYHEDTDGDCTGANNCTGFTGNAQKGFDFGNMSNNFMGGHFAMMSLIPVATYGDSDSAPAYLDYVYNTLWGTIAKDQLSSNLKMAGGDATEGWGYGAQAWKVVSSMLGFQIATGRPILTETSWPTDLLKANLHRLEPNQTTVPIYGDFYASPTGTNFRYQTLPLYAVNRFISPSATETQVAKWWLDNAPTVSGAVAPSAAEEFLWNNGATSSPQSSLPLYYHAVGNGLVTTRSKWDNAADSVFVAMRLEGKVVSDHEHYDDGWFHITRGGDILTPSQNNGTADAAAHNTIVFNNANPYGVLNSYSPSFAQTAPAITRIADTSGYTYVSGDITPAYQRTGNTDKAKKFIRSFFYLRPNILVVYDVTRSNAAVGNAKSWHMNYPANPTVNGSVLSAVLGSSQIFNARLYPGGGSYAVTNPATGVYRASYTPSTAQEYDQFLHVIEATGSASSQTATNIITGTGGRGALIADPAENKVVMFTADQGGANITSLTYSVDTSAASRHYIADLAPNTNYSVSIDGGAAATYTASGAGVIEFVNPVHSPHSYSITQTGTVPPPTGTTTRVFNGRFSGKWH